jgi:hypothetical protein
VVAPRGVSTPGMFSYRDVYFFFLVWMVECCTIANITQFFLHATSRCTINTQEIRQFFHSNACKLCCFVIPFVLVPICLTCFTCHIDNTRIHTLVSLTQISFYLSEMIVVQEITLIELSYIVIKKNVCIKCFLPVKPSYNNTESIWHPCTLYTV